jgi:hypothetical protein
LLVARNQVERVADGTFDLQGRHMGLMRKAASVLTLASPRTRSRRGPQSTATTAEVKRAHAEAAERDREEAKVAEEQAAAVARASREDEALRRADLEEVAVREAEAVPRNWPTES